MATMKHAGIQTRYSLRRKEHPHCKFATHTQGLQQFIVIDIGKLALAKELRIRFQGGFSCGVCVMLAGSTELDVREIERFYPSDTSSLQISFILSMLVVFPPYIVVFFHVYPSILDFQLPAISSLQDRV